MRERAARHSGLPVQIIAIQEAGFDGFWIHRLLEGNGVESHVVEPAS
ncbi:IS110 family transposase, partial [Roseomonas sp. GCM10028921]